MCTMEDDAIEGGTGDLSIFVFLMRRVVWGWEFDDV